MSAATPSSSTPEAGTSPAAVPQDIPSNASSVDRYVLEYLRTHGHTSAEQAFSESLEGDDKGKGREMLGTTITADELLKKLTSMLDRAGDTTVQNALKDITSLSNTSNLQSLLSSIGPGGTEEILTLDPTDKQEGFRELESWVDGSLDMYKPEFRPILFPIFCHFYLDLVQYGFKDAALDFFKTFSPSLEPMHSSTLHRLSTLRLPSHVQHDELANRFRNDKYVVRMSRTGFNLLVGWLTEGIGGEGTGAGVGFSGDKGKRGRSAVMRVVNNHLRFDVTTASPSAVSANSWEESTGLLSSLIPQPEGSTSSSTLLTNPQAFNASKEDLKLGQPLMSEELRAETEKMLRDQAMIDRDPYAQNDANNVRPPPVPGVTAPTAADQPPQPPTFKTVDIQREVERVRDARKRIRLEPSALHVVDANSPQAAAARQRALPSICAYTLHDVPEGSPCVTFSQDTSLMAAGFEESYIRIWSLKGESLNVLKSDFDVNKIKDTSSIRKIREKGGPSTRKLIGHSGPVYSLAFDPIAGSSGPPKYLLSASADSTARLWSLDTMTNVVVYRGHQNPVWDVAWSSTGIYFATASRDKTARLWSTDRTSALRIYAGHQSDVDCVRFHPNSLYLATGSSDRTARLWDVQKGSCLRIFVGHQDIITTLAFSPDGRYLATAGEDLAVNLWDLGSGRRIKKMLGHTASIYSLAFSAESSMLVSGGADWTVRCWDVKAPGGLAEKDKPKENGVGSGAGVNGMVNGHGNGAGAGHGAAAGGGAGGSKNPYVIDTVETTDLMAMFPTKRTPITNVHFTPRNLCLVAGPYLSPDQHR